MREIAIRIAKWMIAKYAPDMHVGYNPGKKPETREALNSAVKARLDKYTAQGFEDYEEKKENG